MLLTGVAVSIARCGREKEINAQVMAMKEEQTRQELRMQQEYGCDIYGQYEYPYNTMSQDWSGDQVEGFYYHEITEECKKAGGQFPVIMQVYTYIICEQNDVDYEMVFALIERESKCVWNADGGGGKSSERGICAESRCGEVPDTGADHIRSDEEKERKSCTDRIERCEGEYLERSRNREG